MSGKPQHGFFQGSILKWSLQRWSEEEEEEILWVKAEVITGKDANLDVDHQASNSGIFCVLWGMEENGGRPLLPSHPKLDCAHEGDVI